MELISKIVPVDVTEGKKKKGQDRRTAEERTLENKQDAEGVRGCRIGYGTTKSRKRQTETIEGENLQRTTVEKAGAGCL